MGVCVVCGHTRAVDQEVQRLVTKGLGGVQDGRLVGDVKNERLYARNEELVRRGLQLVNYRTYPWPAQI